MLTDLNIKALAAGILVYAFAVILVTEVGTMTTSGGLSFVGSPLFRSTFWIASTVLLCAGGFLSGLLAGRRGILHGIVVALVGALLAFLYVVLRMPDAADTSTLAGYLTTGVVLSVLAGGNGELMAIKRRGREL